MIVSKKTKRMKHILLVGASSSIGQLLTSCFYGEYILYGTFNCTKPAKVYYEELIKIDFLHKKQVIKLKEYLKKINDIIFCIGDPGITSKNTDYIPVNFVTLRNLIELCQETNCYPRIIFLSTSAVYSSIKATKINENTLIKSSNHYGEAKKQAEELLCESGLPHIIVRFPIVYGKYFSNKFYTLVSGVSKDNAKIFGHGNNRIPFICEEDLATALLKIVRSPNIKNTSFNLSSGSISQKEYWNSIANILGLPPPQIIEIKKAIALAKDSNGDHRKYWWHRRIVESFTRNRIFVCTKAKKELEWIPKGNFKESFNKMFLNSSGKKEKLLRSRNIIVNLENILKKYGKVIDKGLRLGVPQPKPFSKFLHYLFSFSKVQVNNIGTPTRMNISPESTRGLEKEVISWLGIIYGDKNVDGCICTGSTEGNLMALWIAREYLLKYGDPIIITHCGSHYSIKKASRILKINIITSKPEEWDKPFDGEMMKQLLSKCQGPVIYVATAGQTTTGLVDEIDSVEKVLNKSKRKYFIHIDAAIGGFILPFFSRNQGKFFRSKSIMTITTDFHKFGLGPYSSGVFLCRKNLQKNVSVPINYTGMVDDTISGSRPGSISALLWANINYLGEKGLRRNIQKSLELKSFIINKIKLMGIDYFDVRNMPLLNIILSNKLPDEIETKFHLFPIKRRYKRKNVFSYVIYFSANVPKKTYLELLDCI